MDIFNIALLIRSYDWNKQNCIESTLSYRRNSSSLSRICLGSTFILDFDKYEQEKRFKEPGTSGNS